MRLTLITHVVDFIKDDPSDFAHNLGTTVQHRSKNLGR
jgi:hypothetical protein